MSFFLTPDTDEPGTPAQDFDAANERRIARESERVGTAGKARRFRCQVQPVVSSLGEEFPSIRTAATALNVSPSALSMAIARAARGEPGTCAGRTWSYADREACQ